MNNPLIIALDVATTEEALRLVGEIGSAADFYKVGMELYAVGGLPFVSQLRLMGKQIFLDLKLYDISETVKRATQQFCERSGATFLTVHGSRPVMQAALEGRGSHPTKLLAVTVLTSFDQDDLADLGYTVPIEQLVSLRVKKAAESGMDGIVCSPLEVSRVRELAGSKMKLITPGVRSADAATGDQKRVATPRQAMENGADYLVVGRQVTRAAEPRQAVEEILQEIAG